MTPLRSNVIIIIILVFYKNYIYRLMTPLISRVKIIIILVFIKNLVIGE